MKNNEVYKTFPLIDKYISVYRDKDYQVTVTIDERYCNKFKMYKECGVGYGPTGYSGSISCGSVL